MIQNSNKLNRRAFFDYEKCIPGRNTPFPHPTTPFSVTSGQSQKAHYDRKLQR